MLPLVNPSFLGGAQGAQNALSYLGLPANFGAPSAALAGLPTASAPTPTPNQPTQQKQTPTFSLASGPQGQNANALAGLEEGSKQFSKAFGSGGGGAGSVPGMAGPGAMGGVSPAGAGVGGIPW